MARLATLLHGAADDTAGHADEVARRLILRIAELSGGKRPDWHDDWRVFDHRTIARLVERFDAELGVSPRLDDLARGTGLSPSHFARKFRRSTGLSLYRFVNRRRILRSMESLPDDSQTLAQIALDLGFASQSHFTRLFSKLTGMTPAKYRKQFRRTLG
jgi:AraC-like DNA-binding protein